MMDPLWSSHILLCWLFVYKRRGPFYFLYEIWIFYMKFYVVVMINETMDYEMKIHLCWTDIFYIYHLKIHNFPFFGQNQKKNEAPFLLVAFLFMEHLPLSEFPLLYNTENFTLILFPRWTDFLLFYLAYVAWIKAGIKIKQPFCHWFAFVRFFNLTQCNSEEDELNHAKFFYINPHFTISPSHKMAS